MRRGMPAGEDVAWLKQKGSAVLTDQLFLAAPLCQGLPRLLFVHGHPVKEVGTDS